MSISPSKTSRQKPLEPAATTVPAVVRVVSKAKTAAKSPARTLSKSAAEATLPAATKAPAKVKAKPVAVVAPVAPVKRQAAKTTVPAKAVAPAKATAPVKAAAPVKASAPAKAAKPVAVKDGKHAGKKPKLVRDSFTFPAADYALIGSLKQRALKAGHEVKKSELLRAGLAALVGLSDAALLKALQAIDRLKLGRPAK